MSSMGVSPDEECTSEDAVESPYMGTIRSKGITRLLLLGTLDIIQVKPPILFLSGQLHEMIPPVHMQMLYANAVAHNKRCSITD
ncbi:hypothetical protein Tco_1179731 [Tanacetum coccineum]